MSDDAVAATPEEKHLPIPVIGRKGPAVAEHDGLSRAPVLVEYLDAVLGLDCRHIVASCVGLRKSAVSTSFWRHVGRARGPNLSGQLPGASSRRFASNR